MKKFIALLLSFIMVFTIMPPIVGPAVRAAGNITTTFPDIPAGYIQIIDTTFTADDGNGGSIEVHYYLYFNESERSVIWVEYFNGLYHTYTAQQNIPILSYPMQPSKKFYSNPNDKDPSYGYIIDDGGMTIYMNDMDLCDELNDTDVFNPNSSTYPGRNTTASCYIGTLPENEQIRLPEVTHTELKLPEARVSRTARFLGFSPYNTSSNYTAGMAVSDFITGVGLILLLSNPEVALIDIVLGLISAGIQINGDYTVLTNGGSISGQTIARYRYTYNIVIDNCVEYTVVKDVDYLHSIINSPTISENFYRYRIYFPTLPEYPRLPDGTLGSTSLQQLTQYDLCENPWAAYQGHANDPEIAISWGVIDALRYAYTHNGYHNCIDEDPVDTWCDYCGVHVHTYTNCADTTCDDIDCNFDRGSVSGYLEVDGHVYDDCYDLTCNRCDHERTEPHHAMSTPIWEVVGAPDICKIYTKFCTRTGCGYIEAVETDSSHSYTYSTVNIKTADICQKQVATCSICDHSYESYDYDHTWGASGWEIVGAPGICKINTHYCTSCGFTETLSTDSSHDYSNCAESVCSVCDHSRGTVTGYQLGGHVYSDCLDLTCERCDFTRPSASHTMSTPVWEIVGAPGICKINTHFCTRTGCGYTETLSTDTSHDYSNCADNVCNVCDHNRGSVSGYLQSGHVYSDYCTDIRCNRCNHERAASHAMSTPIWEIVGAPGICRINTHFCTNTGCLFTETLSTDTTHDYLNCADNVCNVCDHNRGSVSGYLQSGHVYSNYCTATTCNRTGCGHVRTAPGHSMSTPVWEIVGAPGICKINTHFCTRTGCSFIETLSTDTSHSYSSWTYYSSSKHKRTCSVCDYVQYSSHSYSSWANYSSTQHRRKCSTCGHYTYGSHNWVYTGSGNIYYCSVCGATRS